MISADYVKQLEETIELLKKKFEDYSVETDSLKEYFWNDLTCILPKQEGQVAYSLLYHYDNNTNSLGLAMEKGDYRINCNDIVTPTDVWNEIYGKPSSTSFSSIDKIKQCKDNSIKTEIILTLYTVFVKASSDIAQKTRCGAGNVLVISEEVSTYLTFLDQFNLVESDNRHEGFRIRKFGTIGRFTIFVDKNNKTNKAVVIYKGDEQNDGAGAILDNRGIHHWFRPDGYDNYWNVINIT